MDDLFELETEEIDALIWLEQYDQEHDYRTNQFWFIYYLRKKGNDESR